MPIDYTQFTRQAIQEVWITMSISLALVALVLVAGLAAVALAWRTMLVSDTSEVGIR